MAAAPKSKAASKGKAVSTSAVTKDKSAATKAASSKGAVSSKSAASKTKAASSDTVDWASKPLGEGTAAKVPEQLQKLQSKSKAERGKAAKWLADALLDEGPYPAVGADVVAELLQALTAGAQDPVLTIALLVELAVFGHMGHAVSGVNAGDFRGSLKKAYSAFCAAAPTFETLLGAKEANTRAAAAFALAFISDDAVKVSKVVAAQLEDETDSNVVASSLLAVGLLACHGGPAPKVAAAYLESDEPLVRTAAAVALGLTEKKPKAALTEALVAGLFVNESDLLWFEGNVGFYAHRVLTEKAKAHAAAGVPAVRELLDGDALEDLDEYAQRLLTDTTIVLGFSEFSERAGNPITADELTEEQVELLKSLQTLGIRTAAFQEYGLPAPEALGLLTGSGGGGPLDRMLEVSIGKKSQQMPIWKCLHLVFEDELSEKELGKALVKQVPKSELFEVLTEASQYKNEVPVIPCGVVITCLDALGKDAVEPAQRLATELARTEDSDATGLALLSLNALVRNGQTKLPDEFGAVAAVLKYAADPVGLKQIVASLSPAAREKYQLTK